MFLVSLLAGLIFGVIFGLIFGLTVWLIFGLTIGLGTGLTVGLVGCLYAWLIVSASRGPVTGFKNLNKIWPLEIIQWSWSELPQALRKQRTVMIAALVIWGLGAGLVFGFLICLKSGVIAGLLVAFILGLAEVLYAGLVEGKITTRTMPNEGIRRSLRNALISWLVFGVVFGVVFGLVGVLFGGAIEGLLFGFTYALFAGPIFFLYKGGYAFLQHIALRILLWLFGVAPSNYVRFLDYAAERIFLRKVGGGYIFIHRYLLEYFASLEPEQGDTVKARTVVKS